MSLAIRHNADLQPFNTMALAIKCSHLAVAHSRDDIMQALHYARSLQLPVCVLGGGSNVIFANDYAGLVLVMAGKGIHVVAETEHDVLVSVEAGESWDGFLQYCLDRCWYGLENLAIIPGSVGAAPVQNIGAYGQEVADCIESVQVLYFDGLREGILSGSDCQFAYRDSIFKQQLQGRCVITSVCFRLQKIFTPNLSYKALAELLLNDETLTARRLRETVIHIRQAKLPSPADIPNCGSFFKNPVVDANRARVLQAAWPAMPVYRQADGTIKIAAGWLIERAGWKGRRLGAVGVYPRQALVLVNYGNASYAQLSALVESVKTAVLQQFGIELEQEPVLVRSPEVNSGTLTI